MSARALGARRRGPRRRFRTRPFYISTLLILGLVALHRLAPGLRQPPTAEATAEALLRRGDAPPIDLECRLVRYADDKCAFVQANCEDEAAGLLPYISFYYCTMAHAQPAAFTLLVAWLGLLFTTIGIAASDFFSVNLGTIANILGLSESLAGVTFLAFGNGSPDVFSTFAAMGSNSGSMAVGELIGAAGFITGVVAGSMALVREFRVSRKTFVRDICFFTASVAFAMYFLADGRLLFWECCVMIGFYVFYVVTVVSWHWVSTRRSRRKAREAASRGHVGDDDLAPYRDDGAGGEREGSDDDAPDDTTPVGGRRARPPPDIRALERGPRIEVDTVDSPRESNDAFDAFDAFDAEAHPVHPVLTEAQQERRERHMTAEMKSSMRVNRPRGRRSTSAMAPIRPSLLGALEFRSVLASLQRSGTMHMAPIARRRLTTTAAAHERPDTLGRGYSDMYADAYTDADTDGPLSRSALLPSDAYRGQARVPSRDRALSSGDRPLSWRGGPVVPTFAPYSDAEPAEPVEPAEPAEPVKTAEPAEPAPADTTAQLESHAVSPRLSPHLSPHLSPRPSPHLSPQASPVLLPFPGYTEPLHASQPPSRTSSMPLAQQDDGASFPGLDDGGDAHRPITWWPYSALPPPHMILCTLFPSLVGWREKTVWDRFVSLISAPTVFLLVITLPVVEMETPADEEDDLVDVLDDMDDMDDVDVMDAPSMPVLVVPGETEWQRYRRSTHTTRPHVPAVQNLRETPGHASHVSSAAVSVHSSDSVAEGVPVIRGAGEASPLLHPHDAERTRVFVPAASASVDASTDVVGREASTDGWNRWLVAVQLVAGPVFVAFVIWANMEGVAQPGRALAMMELAALVVAGGLLGVLFATTTAKRRPAYHSLLCFLGFIISVAWISTVAGEVVGVLKAIGVIAGISEAILGLTIFAVGNSLGDLVANITVARLGYPVMALSACFGGPMLNILLGVGIGGAWMTRTTASDTPQAQHEPYVIAVGGTLLVSAVTVLATLVFLLVAVPASGWMMTRRIGITLISMWSVSTILNVVLEITGVWR